MGVPGWYSPVPKATWLPTVKARALYWSARVPPVWPVWVRTPEKSAENADSMRVRTLLSRGAPGPSEAATFCGDAVGAAAPPGPSLKSRPAILEMKSPAALTAEAAMLAGEAACSRTRISARARSHSGGIRSDAVVAPAAPGAFARTDSSSDAALRPA